MSHNINYSIKHKSHSMFSVKEIPWHGLGQIVDKALTSAEAIKEANLDYTVVKLPNFTRLNNIELANPNSFSTVRTDTPEVLGTVGKDYTVIQNSDAFVFFDSIVGEGKAIFETAGALGNGEQVFITAKLPKSIVLDNIDVIDQYLLLSNSHDGSRSIEVLFTPIRVVCNNTLSAAIHMAKNSIKIRHTANAHKRLELAHQLLGIHTELIDEQEHFFNQMVDKQISVEEFKTYICNIFLTPTELKAVANAGLKNIGNIKEISTRKVNVLNNIAIYLEHGPGQAIHTAENTMWGAYNAVTGYYQNAKEFSDGDKKMRSNLYGSNYSKINNAYSFAMNLINGNMEILTNDGILDKTDHKYICRTN